ncbi:MAG: hypothetical protein WDO17_19420 [Alphaproteobacteria bacterium]
MRRLLDAVQHVLQHPLTLLLARLRVIHGRLRKGKLGLDVLDFLLPALRLNPSPTRWLSASN